MTNNEKAYEDCLFEMIGKLVSRVESEVPDSGNFAPVYEYFYNSIPNLNIDRYMLKVFKMPADVVTDQKQRYLEASIYSSAGDFKANILLFGGNKNEILYELKSEDFSVKLNDTYLLLVESLLDY